jgi:hypothetical protein
MAARPEHGRLGPSFDNGLMLAMVTPSNGARTVTDVDDRAETVRPANRSQII